MKKILLVLAIIAGGCDDATRTQLLPIVIQPCVPGIAECRGDDGWNCMEDGTWYQSVSCDDVGSTCAISTTAFPGREWAICTAP